MGHGSGFIIDKNGTLVTNYHVVENAYTLIVRLEINGELMDFEKFKLAKRPTGLDDLEITRAI